MTAAGLHAFAMIVVFMTSGVSIVAAFPIVGGGIAGAAAGASAAAAATALPTATAFSNYGGVVGRRQLRQQIRRKSRSTPTRGLVAMALPSRPACVGLFAAGMVFGCCISPGVTSSFRLYRTVPDIPQSLFKNHASLKGKVVSVSDGDSIRVRHTPTVNLPLPGRNMEGKKKSEETLQIRLYAVDCPEVAHFGNPAQPFSAEAKEFTKHALQGKKVKITLLRMDQYQRAVCRVQYGRWPLRRDVSAELIKNGLGVLYRQGGAEYDGREAQLAGFEASAKGHKEGLWTKANGETPAQYKARVKNAQPAGAK